MRAYLAHPYETYRHPDENRALEEALYKVLSASNPDTEFVRPLKLIPEHLSRVEAMWRCFDLIDTCDVLIASPDWIKSAGCRAEVDYALRHSVPVKTFELRDVQGLDFTVN